ncbi:hypothetical protein HMPREF0298_0668, partial [Corynebacterium lipophiloflavum DSM 44291]
AAPDTQQCTNIHIFFVFHPRQHTTQSTGTTPHPTRNTTTDFCLHNSSLHARTNNASQRVHPQLDISLTNHHGSRCTLGTSTTTPPHHTVTVVVFTSK